MMNKQNFHGDLKKTESERNTVYKTNLTSNQIA